VRDEGVREAEEGLEEGNCGGVVGWEADGEGDALFGDSFVDSRVLLEFEVSDFLSEGTHFIGRMVG